MKNELKIIPAPKLHVAKSQYTKKQREDAKAAFEEREQQCQQQKYLK